MIIVKKIRFLFIGLMALFLLNSCSSGFHVEKRKYQKGYYVEWPNSKKVVSKSLSDVQTTIDCSILTDTIASPLQEKIEVDSIPLIKEEKTLVRKQSKKRIALNNNAVKKTKAGFSNKSQKLKLSDWAENILYYIFLICSLITFIILAFFLPIHILGFLLVVIMYLHRVYIYIFIPRENVSSNVGKFIYSVIYAEGLISLFLIYLLLISAITLSIIALFQGFIILPIINIVLCLILFYSLFWLDN